jgi:hypothetical protein
MNADFQRWRACAWLRGLVFQWHKTRGCVASRFQRPFGKDWEELLEDSDLISAESRAESFCEAKQLESAGFVELKTHRYRPYQIERVVIPFTAEPRLRGMFGSELPDAPDPKFNFTSVQWASELAFLNSESIYVSPDDLLKLNEFLLKKPRTQSCVPIKERSLEIFGDEKRLDALVSTSLFRAGRMDWERDLKCEIVGEPLAWKRGPDEASTQPLLVIENAATWHSYCRWNVERRLFSAVVYGCGNRFVDGIRYLPDIFTELGGPRRVWYFGDLDPRGVEIPQEANSQARNLSLPPVEPHLWSYRQLLAVANNRSQPHDVESPSSTPCDWLSDCAEPVRQLFAAGQRLAQEHIGWEYLSKQAEFSRRSLYTKQ